MNINLTIEGKAGHLCISVIGHYGTPLKERGMRKEDLRLVAGLTINMIANIGKGKNIIMETLARICETLNCGILGVIELEQDKIATKAIE